MHDLRLFVNLHMLGVVLDVGDLCPFPRTSTRCFVYFSGTYMELLEAPIPGVPCCTFLLVKTNSPR